MRNVAAVLWLCGALGAASISHAELYQVQESTGATLFTNVYQPNAVLVTPKPITVMSSQRIKAANATVKPTPAPSAVAANTNTEAASVTSVASNRRVSVDFLLPAPNQAFIITEGLFSANVRVRPDLQQGERVNIYVDNQLIGAGNNATVLFEKIGLGEHRLNATVWNAQDQVLASTETVFYVLQPVQGTPVAKRK